MSRIKAELFSAIKKKLGLSTPAVYKRISERANILGVRNEIAALDVAASHRITINRYANEDSLKELREARRTNPTGLHSAVSPVTTSRATKKKSSAKSKLPGKKVWVVHGRDIGLRTAMYDFLRSIGLEPLEWSQAVKATRSGAPYIGDVLDKAFAKASAVIILMTPDDEAQLKKEHWERNEESFEKKLMGQARPNVLFEAGIAFGTHPNQTIIVEIGKCRPFSDTAGRLIIRMNDTQAKRRELADRLSVAGCDVDMSDSGWTNAGSFAPKM